VFIYDATTTRIFEMPPYYFFAVIGVVFSSSLFIVLLSKVGYDVKRYTKIFFFSSAGLLIGAKIFGILSGLYLALANGEPVTFGIVFNTGIVFLGGLLGFIGSFWLICKVWNKEVDYGAFDLVAVCIPLFHFWARTGCFFAGCCYGVQTNSQFSVLYTSFSPEGVLTAARIPVQLIEALVNLLIFVILLLLLIKKRLVMHLLKIYLLTYASSRIILEFFRGDLHRGVWNGVSFSQIVSVIIVICTVISLFKAKEKANERYDGNP
jgi:phosphatidylglycerol:prolipoprotein diacylglycerol transferase